MSFLGLPLDVIERILIMLPVETLLILKLVNKRCLEIISSSDFVRMQLKHSSILSNYGIIVTSKISRVGVSIDRISIEQFMQQPYGLSPVSLRKSPDKVVVVGSCNGLICLFTKKYNECRLWNPCTGKSKLLCYLDSAKSYEVIGFGYDERHNDYKVVASCSFRERNAYVSKAKVLSLKRNSWKRVTCLAGWVLDNNTSVFASGKIHWLANLDTPPPRTWNNPYEECRMKKIIVCFDLENEEFDTVEAPPSHCDGPNYVTTVSALDSRLCVVCCDHKRGYGYARDLWRMEENGGWIKLVSIPDTIIKELIVNSWLIPSESEGGQELRPCYMLPNGEIVFEDTKGFLVYDTEDIELTRIQFHNSNGGSQRPIIHVQTLVSPTTLP